MSSPVPAFEARAARLRLTTCLEAWGAITPDVFAYREAITTSTPVLVARAVAERSLALHSSVAIGDHDESDAFFRGRTLPRSSPQTRASGTSVPGPRGSTRA